MHEPWQCVCLFALWASQDDSGRVYVYAPDNQNGDDRGMESDFCREVYIDRYWNRSCSLFLCLLFESIAEDISLLYTAMLHTWKYFNVDDWFDVGNMWHDVRSREVPQPRGS